MSILSLCEEYFGTRDIYKLLDVEKDALAKDIKKAYYKLSLQVHPDRVKEEDKQKSTEKFKVLSKIYQVLDDADKRKLYDEQQIIDDDDMESKLTSWLELWRKIFKPLTEDDITNYMNTYVGSDLEKTDMKKSYIRSKGCINTMMNEVPFLKVEDEARLQEIIGEMIASGEVPEFKIFTKEPAAKRNRRHKKYSRESKEAEEIKAKLSTKNSKASNEGGASSLEQAIMSRQQSRESSFNTLMDKLMEKYGDDDDDEAIDIKDLGKRKKKTPKANGEKQKPSVASGKIKKRKN